MFKKGILISTSIAGVFLFNFLTAASWGPYGCSDCSLDTPVPDPNSQRVLGRVPGQAPNDTIYLCNYTYCVAYSVTNSHSYYGGGRTVRTPPGGALPPPVPSGGGSGSGGGSTGGSGQTPPGSGGVGSGGGSSGGGSSCSAVIDGSETHCYLDSAPTQGQ